MELKFIFVLTIVLACIRTNSSFNANRVVDGSNWMKDNIALFGKKTLKEICIPGSHDSGMSEYKKGTAFAPPCNVITQSFPIRDQLKFGARYFDVRPALEGEEFVTGHYINLARAYQGGNGQSIESIVADVNQFIEKHNELVIISLSKSLNLKKGSKFDGAEWDTLFRLLDETNNLFFSVDTKIYLPGVTLGQFTNDGTKGAVLYVVNEDVELGSRLGRGYFNDSNLNLYNKYSNINNLEKMMRDQISKMKTASKSNYFLLSWTLTQGIKHAGLCLIDKGKSILDLSAEANSKLSDIIPEVNSNVFPNILYVDNIKDTTVLDTVLEINSRHDLPASNPSGASSVLFAISHFHLIYIIILYKII